MSSRFAQALEWDQSGARLEQVRRQVHLDITKAYVGDQPAIVFASNGGTSASSMVSDAALYAYHASIPWGVAVSDTEAIVFNSHWLRGNYWYCLPAINLSDLEDFSTSLLQALTPANLIQGKADSIAASYSEPDKILTPVDDALVERLAHWRKRTLGYAKDISRLDEKLQILFTQLFILRSVEDRNLAPGVPSLKTTISGSWECDLRVLRLVFDSAQENIEHDLFSEQECLSIPSDILGGIIKDLYKPYHLPQQLNAKYDFSWIDADVLGSAYEKYLSNVLVPASIANPQFSLFGGIEHDVEEISIRKSAGVYYTPPFLVRLLTERSLDAWQGNGSLAENLPRVADFSCGSGSFLRAAADSLIRRLRKEDPEINWGRRLIEGRHIIGIDIDARAVSISRMQVYLRLTEEPDPLPLPRLSECIVQGDSLDDEVWEKIPDNYDAVVGNPPFLATGRVQSKQDLASRFRTARGRFDYSYLFVELGLNKLSDGGTLGLVIPNRLFHNRDAGTLRELIAQESDILSVLDFGANEVFSGISAYIGTIILRKGRSPLPARKFRYVKIKSLPKQYQGSDLSQAINSEREVRTAHLYAYDVIHPQGTGPWLFWSPSASQARLKVEEVSERLSAVAHVWQGIRTGANDVFIATLESSPEDRIVQIKNKLGYVHTIESHLTKPMIYGSDIGRYDLVAPSHVLVYPYVNGNLVPQAEMRENYPLTFEYFEQYRPLLASRSSLNSGNLEWYELVRKRDESWLEAPKLITKDLSTEPSFALDLTGGTYLVGGTAIVPNDPDAVRVFLAYLNSSLAEWYLDQMTPSFRGSYRKIEPQHLNDLPVPTFLLEDIDAVDEINALVQSRLDSETDGSSARNAELEINALLADKLGVDLKTL